MGKEPADYEGFKTHEPTAPIELHLDPNSSKPKGENIGNQGNVNLAWVINNAKELLLICDIFKGRSLCHLEIHTEIYTNKII